MIWTHSGAMLGMSKQEIMTPAQDQNKRKAGDGAGVLSPVAGASSSQGGGRGGGGRDNEMAELVALQARLTLRNARAIADLQAQVQHVVLVGKDHAIVAPMQSAQRWYSAQVSGNPGHCQGQPDFDAWRALVTVAAGAPTTWTKQFSRRMRGR